MAKKNTSKIVSQFSFSFNDFENPTELIHNLIEDISILIKEVEFDTFAMGISWPKESNIDELKKSVQYSLIEQISSKFEKNECSCSNSKIRNLYFPPCG